MSGGGKTGEKSFTSLIIEQNKFAVVFTWGPPLNLNYLEGEIWDAVMIARKFWFTSAVAYSPSQS